MPYESHHEKGRDGGSGWLILGGLFALGILGKTIEYLASQIATSGPSGAYALGALGLAACGAFAGLMLGPIGRAVGRRILQGGASAAASDEDVHELRLQVEELRQALTESQDRIEFAERMLAAGNDPAREKVG